MTDSSRVLRHKLAHRIFHWTTATCVLVLLTTGLLPIFGIKFSWLVPHWIAGLVLIAAVLWHIFETLRTRTLGRMWAGVRESMGSARYVVSVLTGNNARSVKPGKYSLAQKIFHLAATVVVLVAAVTGIIMMIGIDTPFWDRDPYFVSEQTRGIVFVAHGLATLFFITMIIVHVYFALRPEKRYFLRSMINGWITRREYEDNHDQELWNEDKQ
jgi:cytochrome b subunit of formate dehydrogenase